MPLHHTRYNRDSHGRCFHPVFGSCSFPLTPSHVAVWTRHCSRQTTLTYGGAYVKESLAPMASSQSDCWCVTHSMLELYRVARPAGASKIKFFLSVCLEQLPLRNKIKCFFAFQAIFSLHTTSFHTQKNEMFKKKNKNLNLSDKECVYFIPHLSSGYFVQNPSLFQRGKLKTRRAALSMFNGSVDH